MGTREATLFMVGRMMTHSREMKVVIICMAIAATIQSLLGRTMIGLMVVKETICFGATKGQTFSTFRLEMTRSMTSLLLMETAWRSTVHKC